MGWRRFWIEFGLFVVPQAAIFTYPIIKTEVVLYSCGIAVTFLALRLLFGKMPPRTSQADYFAQARLPFITHFRSSIMLLTVLCILAVDFLGFPRTWAKTETFGTSVMDVGVGAIVFASGLVAATGLYAGGGRPSLFASIRTSTSMFILGLARVFLVKAVGYQEHVTEYGVHWNFFLTLAALPLIVYFISRVVPVRRFGSAAIILAVGYEALLRYAGLQDFIFEDHRDNLVAMNKEGLASLVGYTSLFLLGCAYGCMVQGVRLAKVKNRVKLGLLKMMGVSGTAWLTYTLLQFLGFEPSRRLANLNFVIWSSAVSTTHLLMLFILDATFLSPMGQSALLGAINDNQLLTFLMANLGTGLVNLSIQTLLLPQPASMLVLLGYSLVVCTMVFLLKRLRISFRFK